MTARGEALMTYRNASDALYAARYDVEEKHYLFDSQQGPLGEQASIYEDYAVSKDTLRLDRERLLGIFTSDLLHEQETLGNA